MTFTIIALLIALIAALAYHWVVVNAADSLEKMGIGDIMRSTNNNGVLIQSFIDDCDRLYNVSKVERGHDNCLITVNGLVKIWIRASENSVFGFVDFVRYKRNINKMSLPAAKLTVAQMIKDESERGELPNAFKQPPVKGSVTEPVNLERYKLKRGK